MKIKLKDKLILKNIFSILIFAILISCDSVGDSDNSDTQNVDPVTPTVQPTAPVSPTNEPQPPPVITMPQPTALPTIAPNPTQSPDEPLNDFQSEVLNLVNEARSEGRNCGAEFYPPAPFVSWDVRIQEAALTHSLDMAQNQNFSHTGTDGSNAGDRLLMQQYNWSTWGENILVGLDDARAALDAWIGSSGHCSIIMNSSLKQVGAGVAQGIFQGNNASYWTLVFATEN